MCCFVPCAYLLHWLMPIMFTLITVTHGHIFWHVLPVIVHGMYAANAAVNESKWWSWTQFIIMVTEIIVSLQSMLHAAIGKSVHPSHHHLIIRIFLQWHMMIHKWPSHQKPLPLACWNWWHYQGHHYLVFLQYTMWHTFRCRMAMD